MTWLEFLILLLYVPAWWRLFTKAGEPGWPAFVPFLSQCLAYRLVWKTSMFWVTVLLNSFCLLLLQYAESMHLLMLGCLLGIAGVILMCYYQYRLSKAFGHGVGYTIGLIFLGPVFPLILAFGPSEYQGNPYDETDSLSF